MCFALFKPIMYLIIASGANWGGLLIELFSMRHVTAQRAREEGKSSCLRCPNDVNDARAVVLRTYDDVIGHIQKHVSINEDA